MKDKKTAAFFLTVLVLLAVPMPLLAGTREPLRLLLPQKDGGQPLMKALAERKSTREFSGEELAPQVLSGLLWAAAGVNRPDGRRTVPSAHNAREIDIYVAKKEGLYLYNAEQHALIPVLAKDIRPFAGKQDFVREAPVGLIFVADPGKFRGGSEEDAKFYSAADTGFISQNVYLYCASEGLATVVLGWIDRERLAKEMGLRPEQKIILTQPVGYAKKNDR
ncbi:MAG TPA: nitroreductase family protein [Candidatus Omnitrophota bacterium]|nr:nitroreductase family protein [Candidatus Omnitrophota bacterium]